MIVASRKTLTWGTIAAAVASALLLACAGGSMPRIAGIIGDAMRAWQDDAAQPVLTGERATPANDAQRGAASVGDLSSR